MYCLCAKKQLKEMAERLPVGAARNIKSPSIISFASNTLSNELSNVSVDRLNGQLTFQEPDSNGSNGHLLSNGSSISSSRSSGHNRQVQSETTNRNGSRMKEGDPRNDNEWVEQDEPGVYITLTSLPGGAKDLKRVRFRYAYIISVQFHLKSNFPQLFWIVRHKMLNKLHIHWQLAPRSKPLNMVC